MLISHAIILGVGRLLRLLELSDNALQLALVSLLRDGGLGYGVQGVLEFGLVRCVYVLYLCFVSDFDALEFRFVGFLLPLVLPDLVIKRLICLH
jgi:hypothetical protein